MNEEIQKLVEEFFKKHPNAGPSLAFCEGYKAAASLPTDQSRECNLQPEEMDLILTWRKARKCVKETEFSIADRELEYCKKLLGEASDYI